MQKDANTDFGRFLDEWMQKQQPKKLLANISFRKQTVTIKDIVCAAKLKMFYKNIVHWRSGITNPSKDSASLVCRKMVESFVGKNAKYTMLPDDVVKLYRSLGLEPPENI